jgi:hypothetical protein
VRGTTARSCTHLYGRIAPQLSCGRRAEYATHPHVWVAIRQVRNPTTPRLSAAAFRLATRFFGCDVLRRAAVPRVVFVGAADRREPCASGGADAPHSIFVPARARLASSKIRLGDWACASLMTHSFRAGVRLTPKVAASESVRGSDASNPQIARQVQRSLASRVFAALSFRSPKSLNATTDVLVAPNPAYAKCHTGNKKKSCVCPPHRVAKERWTWVLLTDVIVRGCGVVLGSASIVGR